MQVASSLVITSTNAQALFDLLPIDGGASNLGKLKTKLALDNDDFVAAKTELIEVGLAVVKGRGGRIARANSETGDVSFDAAKLFSALPSDGSTFGNHSLRSHLGLDETAYAEAKRELRAKGLIKIGVGYGGTVARVDAVMGTDPKDKQVPSELVKLERDLYQPFVDWLSIELTQLGVAFAKARITAPPRGYRRNSGRWSRPDVTAVQVSSYEWLPDITVEVSTYEIKPAAEANKLDIVYEAAAHGRWAHRASLVIEHAESADGAAVETIVDASIIDEIRRFRLGLYAMWRHTAGGFGVRELIPPRLTHESEPDDLNKLIRYFLGEDEGLRQNYRRAIGH